MEPVGVIAVVGAGDTERGGYATALAHRTNRALIPASRLSGSPDPAQEAAVLASWTDVPEGVVVDMPDEVPAGEIIGTFVDVEQGSTLLGIVCVVDAARVRDELRRVDDVPLRDRDSGIAALRESRARLTAWQIEFASTIALVNWSTLAASELSLIASLLSHLSPRARLRLHGGIVERLVSDDAYAVEQDRPGWMCLLNESFDPPLTDPRVSALRYEQVRPLHPGRLAHLLDARIEPGEFGTVVRSAGFCRLASRGGIVAQWEHVGSVISLNPVAVDARLDDADEMLSLGQDLAFVGIDLDRDGLVAALDEAALTDAELAEGPEAWARFADPFPTWATASDRQD
ncbi:GTP-binding protein [uncultured Microbacterium sp.]|uniref:GTP-binding protein n=1 Tax=uncultured Microbacterium sp. TaxID=191216 RepID=UPI0025F5F61D|nr:GTP-binding protein [uncultured Microbacterium sp.]